MAKETKPTPSRKPTPPSKPMGIKIGESTGTENRPKPPPPQKK